MCSVISLHTRSPFPVVKKSVGLTGLLRGAFIHSVFWPTEEPVLWMFLSGSEALVIWTGFHTWLFRAFPDHSDKWQVVCGLTEYLAQIRKYRIMGHHTKLRTFSPLEFPPSHSFKITLFVSVLWDKVFLQSWMARGSLCSPDNPPLQCRDSSYGLPR